MTRLELFLTTFSLVGKDIKHLLSETRSGESVDDCFIGIESETVILNFKIPKHVVCYKYCYSTRLEPSMFVSVKCCSLKNEVDIYGCLVLNLFIEGKVLHLAALSIFFHSKIIGNYDFFFVIEIQCFFTWS